MAKAHPISWPRLRAGEKNRAAETDRRRALKALDGSDADIAFTWKVLGDMAAIHFRKGPFGGGSLAQGRDAIDGCLLRVLDPLLVEGRVSRAARRFNPSQPAVSSAQRRLREITGDQLLVQGRGGMTPTERGAALLEPVKLALAQLEAIVTPPAVFEANVCRREFNIGSPDCLDTRAVGDVLARMQAGAPSAQINLHSMGASAFYAGALESGEMDVVIGNCPNPPDTLRTTSLFQDRMVLLMLRSQPLAEQELSASRYLEASHLVPTPYSVGQRGVIDMYLARERLRRNVVAHVPYFNITPYLLLQTDMVFTAPARFAEHCAGVLPLVIRPRFPIPCCGTIGRITRPSVAGFASRSSRCCEGSGLGTEPGVEWLPGLYAAVVKAIRDDQA